MNTMLPEAYAVDPACHLADRLVDHVCSTPDGKPLGEGETCWYPVRSRLLDERTADAVNQAIANLRHLPVIVASLGGALAGTPSGATSVPLSEPAAVLAASGHLRPASASKGITEPQGDPPAGGDQACDNCGRPGPDQAAISYEDKERGFCSKSCMCIYVREVLMSGAANAPRPQPRAVGVAEARGVSNAEVLGRHQARALPSGYVHPNCRWYGHVSCPLPLACACPCHLEQAVRLADEATG